MEKCLAFVLGGGGARGALQGVALRALFEQARQAARRSSSSTKSMPSGSHVEARCVSAATTSPSRPSTNS